MSVNPVLFAEVPGISPAGGAGPVSSPGWSNEPKANILLVDDHPEKLLALQSVLVDLGQNLVTARSGKDALRLLLRQDFAVILLDVSMPGMDGFETASLIRKRPKSENTPIIFITAVSSTETNVFKGYSLGAVDYIMSPIIPEILRAKVSVFVELYKKTEQIKQQAERLREIEEAEHKRALAEAETRLDAETKRNLFFMLAVDMLGILSFDGYFLQLNPSWEKSLGLSNEELKTAPLLELVHPDDRLATAHQVDQLKGGLVTTYFENRYRCKDGSYRWLGWTASPFPAEKLIYIFARDITTRKLSEEEIRNLNSQLNNRLLEVIAINKELETFSYSIAHDLRAPLRAMLGFSEALLEDCSDELASHGKEYAQRIISSAKHMDCLIRDLLDYSRLSTAQLPRTPVSVDMLVKSVLEQLRDEIREKEAVVEVEPALPTLVGHAPTIHQIIMNLVCNALKFVDPDRGPRIRIFSEKNSSVGRFCVEDNGIGIAIEHQERIFGMFERLHDKDQYPGTGIGLAIVRKALERMNGQVGVESAPGKGSRFWFELPLAAQL
jgi:PAS domain S-box-containing protein